MVAEFADIQIGRIVHGNPRGLKKKRISADAIIRTCLERDTRQRGHRAARGDFPNGVGIDLSNINVGRMIHGEAEDATGTGRLTRCRYWCRTLPASPRGSSLTPAGVILRTV